ncbi:MAG: hypothetical protein KME17_12330 [Cyanosarcina radialis HA8281-LM2]|jgi:hypothetical protein|nr:hypothetical protein [Cyanosarcina radialis HA8281-LM2]
MKITAIALGLSLILLSSCSGTGNSAAKNEKVTSTDGKFAIELPGTSKPVTKEVLPGVSQSQHNLVRNNWLYQFSYLTFQRSFNAKEARTVLNTFIERGAVTSFPNGQLLYNKAIVKGNVPCQDFLVKWKASEQIKKDFAKEGFKLEGSEVYWKGVNCLAGSNFAEAGAISNTQPDQVKEVRQFFDSFVARP